MSDISTLELEFAKSPSLDTCIPLCEAYIGANRFMEAMVVCKKGIKGSPEDPRGKTMLARVYLEQGKLPKAQQELDGLGQQFPGLPSVLELQGRLQMLGGNREPAIAFFQQALQGDPSLRHAPVWLAELGGAVPAPMPTMMQNMPTPAPAAPPQPAPGMAPPAGSPFQAPPMMPPQTPHAGAGTGPVPMGDTPTPAGVTSHFPSQSGFPPSPMEPTGSAVSGQSEFSMPATSGSPTGETEKLEHVSDFFAADNLGFASDDTSHIETAGPGRLTIVGFVPKNTGSLKKTILLSMAGLAILASVLFYVFTNSQKTKKISGVFEKIRSGIDSDLYQAYKNASVLGDEIFALNPEHPQTLSAVGFAEAVLAADHGEKGAQDKAKAMLTKAEQTVKEPNQWLIGTQALVAYLEGKYEDGLSKVEEIAQKSANTIVQQETFRLHYALKPDDKGTKTALRRFTDVANGPRSLTFLGWHYFLADDWARADKYFGNALQSDKTHPRALAGKVLTDLARGTAVKGREKDIKATLEKLFKTPKEELSARDLALAHFARSRFYTWKGRRSDAQKELDKALKSDPKNTMIYFRLGTDALAQSRNVDAVKHLKKAVELEPSNIAYLQKLVEAQTRSGDYSGAEVTLARASGLAPGRSQIVLLRADLLLEQKRFGDARSEYKKINATDHDTKSLVQATAGIARSHRGEGKASAAVSFLKGFLAKAPNKVQNNSVAKAELFTELGLSHEDNRKKNQAQASYRLAIETDATYADSHYYLCKSIGRGGEARKACAAYLEIAPLGKHAADARKRSRK